MATEDQINKELEKTSNQVEIGTFAQIAALKDLIAELYQTQLQVDRTAFDVKFRELSHNWEAHFKEEIFRYSVDKPDQSASGQ